MLRSNFFSQVYCGVPALHFIVPPRAITFLISHAVSLLFVFSITGGVNRELTSCAVEGRRIMDVSRTITPCSSR